MPLLLTTIPQDRVLETYARLSLFPLADPNHLSCPSLLILMLALPYTASTVPQTSHSTVEPLRWPQ